MLLTPRYGSTPVLEFDGNQAAVGELLIRQRRRLVQAVCELTDEQWAHPSRCEGWSTRDVVAHLAMTNFFWEASIRAGIGGEPTRLLTGFDPVASPAQSVEGSAQSTSEIIEAMSATTESLAACLSELGASDWSALAESPPGHVSISAVAHHALWDSWIHERDVMLPLETTPAEEPDEVVACLRYVAGLTPALVLNAGGEQTGRFDVDARSPDVGFHVEIGTEVKVTDGTSGGGFTLGGSAIDLVEALSFRQPLDQEIPSDIEWAFSGLATVFDQQPHGRRATA